MDPVKRSDHNFNYLGPTDEIGDLSVRRTSKGAFSHWRPTEAELAILNQGGVVELGVYQAPMPPVSVGVVPVEPCPGSPDGEHDFEDHGGGAIRCKVCGVEPPDEDPVFPAEVWVGETTDGAGSPQGLYLGAGRGTLEPPPNMRGTEPRRYRRVD